MLQIKKNDKGLFQNMLFLIFFFNKQKKLNIRPNCTFPKCPLPSTAISLKSWRVSGTFLCLMVETDKYIHSKASRVHPLSC